MAQALTISLARAGLRKQAAQAKAGAARVWRAYPRETVGVGVLGAVLLVGGIGGAVYSMVNSPAAAQTLPPPAPPPMIVRDLPAETAVQVNAGIGFASGPNPAARPFDFKGDKAARARALECLTSAIYYEAGQESADGQRAVAQVVLNRVRHSAFPASVCGVVYEGSTRATGCQFTFTCDGSLYRGPDAAGWRRAAQVAEAALSGAVYKPVGWATHYHANYVVPYWAPTLAKNTVVGAHIFYRWAGGWGKPDSFIRRNFGQEPNVAALRTAALAAEAATANQPQSRELAEAVAEIPGAEQIRLQPSMRGDKRVALRFNLAAREATDKVEHKDYVEKVAVSDNLKWALSGDSTAAAEKPLGKAAAGAAPASPPAATNRP